MERLNARSRGVVQIIENSKHKGKWFETFFKKGKELFGDEGDDRVL